MVVSLINDLDPLWLAQSRLRRQRYNESIEILDTVLFNTPLDQAAWYLKCRALSLRDWIDDTENEEEGVADILLDENAVAQSARPGTSLARPLTMSTESFAPSTGVKPLATDGRPVTGFARPGTSNRPGTSTRPGSRGAVDATFKSTRPRTSRALTSSGRVVRLGTGSMLTQAGGPFINVNKLDLGRYAAQPHLSRVLCDYLLSSEHNVKKAIELCHHALKQAGNDDWWWKARLGKCLYQMGKLRDAECEFQDSLRSQCMIIPLLELCKVYTRIDQPNSALQILDKHLENSPGNINILTAQARIFEGLNDIAKSVSLYKEVLVWDGFNIEAIACLAANHFYSGQPEVALRLYRRLLQMGVNNAEIWNNLGLFCYYASQYDLALTCFDRALVLGEDDVLADVWYNVGQVAVGIGDLGLAEQAYKVAISVNNKHAESFNNLGVLEGKKGDEESSRRRFSNAQSLGPHLFEPYYNGALVNYNLGKYQDSFEMVNASLVCYPNHADSQDLLKLLKNRFSLL